MLDRAERVICERIRTAQTVKIVLNDNGDNRTVINLDARKQDISSLLSNIRIAFQSFYNEHNNRYDTKGI